MQSCDLSVNALSRHQQHLPHNTLPACAYLRHACINFNRDLNPARCCCVLQVTKLQMTYHAQANTFAIFESIMHTHAHAALEATLEVIEAVHLASVMTSSAS